MDWVDLLIVVVVALAGLLGYAEGALRQVLRLVGLAAGFYVFTSAAPGLSRHVTTSSWRPAAALAIVILGTLLGGALGSTVGGLIAKALHVVHLTIVDRAAGAAIAVAAALVGCWLAAGLLASTTWGSLASGIQRSSILAQMDAVMPPLPSFESKIQSLFRGVDVPAIFAHVVAPSLTPPVPASSLAPPEAPVSSPPSVVKVLASGACPSESEGTAFYVAPDEVLTNAHVVAGHTRISVGGATASVALYDPRNDLAVLRVPRANEPALSFLAAEPRAGTKIQVVGFPENQSRTLAQGYVEGQFSTLSRDIYNAALDVRPFLSLEVSVQPGNSGSPVLVDGRVAGIVESLSLSETDTAYAIPDSVIEDDLARVPASGTASTQRCLS